MPQVDRLLRASEVARRLSISEARVHDLARQHILPAVQLGRQRRFSPEAIDDFILHGGRALAGGWRREADEATG